MLNHLAFIKYVLRNTCYVYIMSQLLIAPKRTNMKVFTRYSAVPFLLPIFMTGCISSGGSTSGSNTVMVSEVVSICGALVGSQAEQRINSEWQKYPEMNASRPIIESMAQVLLSNSDGTNQQGSSDYKKYISCATGLLMANGLLK